MPRTIDLRHHKVQIADRYRIKGQVMIREGYVSGGYVKVRDFTGKVITVIHLNKKSFTAAIRNGRGVKLFNVVQKGPFKVLPIIAEKIKD